MSLVSTDEEKEPNPLGEDEPLFGGSAYIVATREFINWTMTNETVQAFLNWSSDTYSPDEMVWSTLARTDGAPGFRNKHLKWGQNELQTITRIVKWSDYDGTVYPPCTSYYNRGICVYGLKLNLMIKVSVMTLTTISDYSMLCFYKNTSSYRLFVGML